MRRPNSSGMPSRASATSSSNRSAVRSITAPLSQPLVRVAPMENGDLLADLNEAQREAVTTEAAPLAIIAGAGSGKTRVLTRRIAYRCFERTADARHVLALTFTRKAAGELRARLRRLGLRDDVTAGTFHALAYAQLRGWWADRGTPPPDLLERKGRLLARLLGRNSSVMALDVAGEIEWAKARLVAPDEYVGAAIAA